MTALADPSEIINMGRIFAAVFLLVASAVPLAHAEGPNPAFEASLARYESEMIRIARDFRGETPGSPREASELSASISQQLPEIAERAFGRDWGIVRAEAQRAIDALPVFDWRAQSLGLPSFAFKDAPEEETRAFTQGLRDRSRFIASRFWDPETVAYSIALFAIGASEPDGLPRFSMSLAFAPVRAYRTQLDGENAIAARCGWRIIAFKYVVTEQGAIAPDMASVRLYVTR